MCVTRKRTATTATATATEHRYARENFCKNMFYNIYKVAQKFADRNPAVVPLHCE